MTNQSDSAFALLHSGIQRQLWRMKWDELRPLQVKAIHAVVNTSNDVIISAATASGKTEAAFLPVLSRIAAIEDKSVLVMYVGPLKALINDQFSRIEELCNYIEIPVHRWHGDVAASKKKALIKNPSGILLITPESLESILVNHSIHLRYLFHRLQFIVIDELHAFLGNERGLHLRSLLSRIESASAPVKPFRKIGLSATIGDYEAARDAICPKDPTSVTIVHDKIEKGIGIKVHSYLNKADLQDTELVERKIARDLLDHCGNKTNLIFANRRGDVEVFADACKEEAKKQTNNLQQFVVHHGSLSQNIREDSEEMLKSSRSVTAICTSTLELGIDIGSVRMIGQIGAPGAVSSLKQRLGRSGRGEGESQLLRVYLEMDEATQKNSIFDHLYLPLIQTIAVIQLMLDGWVESVQNSSCDLSTLTQQIMSVVAQKGGVTTSDLYDILCKQGAFKNIGVDVFTRLLRRLGQRQEKNDPDVIEQTPTGEIILGLRGETLRRRRDFYAVFNTQVEFSLYYDGRLLGSMPFDSAPPIKEHLLFAGRRWQVIDSDEASRCVFLKPASGRKKPYFAGSGVAITDEVVQRMRKVLQEQDEFTYLNDESVMLLKQARTLANKTKLCSESYIPINASQTALMTWCGARSQTTLWALMQHLKIEAKLEDIGMVCEIPLSEAHNTVSKALNAPVDAITLAQYIPNKWRRKYDFLLGEDLLDIGIARDVIDIEGAHEVLQSLLR